MENTSFPCPNPNCNVVLEIPSEKIGQKYKCPKCNQYGIVPTPIQIPVEEKLEKNANLRSDILNCTNCGQELDSSEPCLGENGLCPTCNKKFLVEFSNDKKECPFCGEQILAKALKCKHCGEFLKEIAAKNVFTGEVPPVHAEFKENKQSYNAKVLWVILLATMVFSLLFISAPYIKKINFFRLLGEITGCEPSDYDIKQAVQTHLNENKDGHTYNIRVKYPPKHCSYRQYNVTEPIKVSIKEFLIVKRGNKDGNGDLPVRVYVNGTSWEKYILEPTVEESARGLFNALPRFEPVVKEGNLPFEGEEDFRIYFRKPDNSKVNSVKGRWAAIPIRP